MKISSCKKVVGSIKPFSSKQAFVVIREPNGKCFVSRPITGRRHSTQAVLKDGTIIRYESKKSLKKYR